MTWGNGTTDTRFPRLSWFFLDPGNGSDILARTAVPFFVSAKGVRVLFRNFGVLILAVVCWFLLIGTPLAAPAKGGPPPGGVGVIGADNFPFATKQTEWTGVLERAQRYVNGRNFTPQRSQETLDALAALRTEAQTARELASKSVDASQSVIDALGPVPAEGAPPEAPEIVARRKQFGEALALHRAHIAQVDVVLAQVKAMETQVSDLRRLMLVDRLQTYHSVALSTQVLERAWGDLYSLTVALASTPTDWYDSLSEEQKGQLPPYRIAFMLIAGGLAGWGLSRTILRRFGPDPLVTAPSYRRRVGCAMAETVARGLVPSALVTASYLWLDRTDALSGGMFTDMVTALLGLVLFLVLMTALSRAILSPDLPAWRLTSLAPEQARAVSRGILAVALLFALDVFFYRSIKSAGLSPELHAMYRLLFNVSEGLGILLLTSSRRWKEETSTPATAEEPQPPTRTPGVPIRRVVIAATLLAMLATLAGYAEFGRYLIHNMFLTAAVVGGVILAQGLLHEVLDLVASSSQLHHWFQIQTETLKSLRFWARVLLDPLLLGLGVLVIAPSWGIPRDDLMRWAGVVLTGFPVGNVTISILGILSAVGTFLGAVLVTRVIQRRLLEKVLPQTNLDRSVQHSLSAGLGYLGVVVAGALGITVLGVDLTSLAMVAGALSVGIGFGLQNIVNNFVSGLILLVERPIRVGDWIHVGSREGIVKRISIRATELETWERASVIIPNAELLSGNLLNWTLKDKAGRIDIKVGVAYGSNLEVVRDILSGCAARHPHILVNPRPLVLFQDFGDNSLLFELRCYTDDVLSRMRFASELRFDIELQFREAGIDIPFPQRVVRVMPQSAPN
ncbi:MAG: mechanosensitive ion channel family protein [Alphaproteobacteria bacterium]